MQWYLVVIIYVHLFIAHQQLSVTRNRHFLEILSASKFLESFKGVFFVSTTCIISYMRGRFISERVKSSLYNRIYNSVFCYQFDFKNRFTNKIKLFWRVLIREILYKMTRRIFRSLQNCFRVASGPHILGAHLTA